MTQNQQLNLELPDHLISYSKYNDASKTWEGGTLGQVVLPANRNPRPNNQPYKTAKVSINLKKIMELVQSGQLKQTQSGYIYLDMGAPLTDEQKEKVKASRKTATPKQEASNASSTKSGWGTPKTSAPKTATWGTPKKGGEEAPF